MVGPTKWRVFACTLQKKKDVWDSIYFDSIALYSISLIMSDFLPDVVLFGVLTKFL